MSLFQLPPEILTQIFDYIGASYFRSDLSRLTVCNQWYAFACTACFQDFYLDRKTLRRLKSSSNADPSLAILKDSMRTLDLNLNGFEDWDSIQQPEQEPKIADLDMSAWNGVYGRAARAAWTAELNKDLIFLASMNTQSRKLRTLRIRTTSEVHPLLPLLGRRDYLLLSTMRAFLTVNNLSTLDLDLCGTRLMTFPRRFHICPSIAALLTTLRRLRLRMRNICTDFLKPPKNSNNLRLNEMLVNLSLSNESPLITSAVHATCCGTSTVNFLQLKADMEKHAQALVSVLAAPKIVRILTHTHPAIELRALDVLTGRSIKLSEGAEWDDDGEAIEDETTDEESEISDLPSEDDE